jgi:hypothetical protein
VGGKALNCEKRKRKERRRKERLCAAVYNGRDLSGDGKHAEYSVDCAASKLMMSYLRYHVIIHYRGLGLNNK